MLASGRVLELHRWPVKSVGGQPVETFEADERGVADDRTHALFDRSKDAPRRLTARQALGLLRWGAAYENADGFAPAGAPDARRARRRPLRLRSCLSCCAGSCASVAGRSGSTPGRWAWHACQWATPCHSQLSRRLSPPPRTRGGD